jgi:competence protein ComEC
MAGVTTGENRRRTTNSSYHPLVVTATALATGIALDRFGCIALSVAMTFAFVAWLAWFGAWRRGWHCSAAILLLVSVASLGAAWHHCCWGLFAEDELGRAAGPVARPICVEAVALGGPRRIAAPPHDPLSPFPKGDESRLAIAVTAVRDGSTWTPASGQALLIVEGHLPGVHAGDRLQIFGNFYASAPPKNPREFDRAAHTRADRRLCQLRSGFPGCVTVTSDSPGVGSAEIIETARDHFQQQLRTHLHHEQSDLAQALLLGAREQLERERTAAFFETGTIHLLAISGLHVGILASLFFVLARMGILPRRLAIVSAAVFVVSYALLTEMRPPVVRATVLVLVTCGAWLLQRRALTFNALALAGIIVLAINPADLFQAGTQLSFLAVGTVVWLRPHLFPEATPDALTRLIARTRPWTTRTAKAVATFVFQITLAGIVIWLVALPLVMYRFHLVAPIAILLTPILWIPISIALLSGFAVLVFGWLFPPIAAVFGWMCDASLTVLEWCVQVAQDVPHGHFWTAGPALWWVIGFYAGLALMAALPRLRPPRRWCATLLVVWIAIGLGVSMFDRGAWIAGDGELDCTFISVGHGCATLLELPGGQTMLCDAGRLGPPSFGTESVSAVLWSRGITHIDAVVLSHADIDHYNILPGLLDRFSVGAVYVSPVMFRDETPALSALRTAIEEKGIPIYTVYSGDTLKTECPTRIEVLHPPEKGVLGKDNANSMVLLVEYAGHRVLLPSDIESPGLEDLLAETPVPCDVVMAPHHGSQRSNPAGFSSWCTPKWVIISAGTSSDVSAVAATYEQSAAEVLNTAQVGAVHARLGPDGVHVEGYRANQER